MDRRKFLSGVAATSATFGLSANAQQPSSQAPPRAVGGKRPILVASANGLNGSDGGYTLLTRGRDTLDAVAFVLKVQEDDPTDDSVGLGGLPNEDGVVELDACVMHGPTRRAGAVAGVREIRNVHAVARLVMERTNHLLLVGEGAQRFALAHGFQRENLLTERSRKIWMLWKETMSNQDGWGPGLTSPDWKSPLPAASQSREQKIGEMLEVATRLGIEPEFRAAAIRRVLAPPPGTIHCSAVNEKGEMSGGTTTSGLAWKLAGRVGDSPLVGAGCYTDQDVGSAGATGTGEECIKICGAHTIVENMREGLSPQEAGVDALKRIARNHNHDMNKLRFVSMQFYVLRKDGAYAGCSLWSKSSDGKRRMFCVHDGTKRLEDSAFLFDGQPFEWPPILDEQVKNPAGA